MINAKKLISDFSMPEKVDLFNALYWDISERGTDGDTELAHVNTFEARWLKSMGGSGTINELTGLREYKGGGGSPPPPQPVTTQDITQTAEFPEELKPHISRIAGEAQAEYDAGRAEGFLPFPGPKLAGFRPEQQAAFELGRQQFGTGLAGTGLGDPRLFYGEGLESLRTGRGQLGEGTEEITSEEIQGRINPFQQNVIDIAKREARRDEDVARQVRGREAAGAASYGGSRAGVMEAEAGRNLAQQLSDIQERGLYAGYDTASRGLEEERKRQLLGGQQLGGLGAQFATMGEGAADRARRQIAGLAGVGEVQQGQRQQALDLARQQFEQEKFFPKGELQAYQSIIRGFPSAPGSTKVQKEPLIQTPLSSQLINAGLSGLNLYGNLGGFKRGNTGGQVGSFAGGGIVSLQAGSLEEAMLTKRQQIARAIQEAERNRLDRSTPQRIGKKGGEWHYGEHPYVEPSGGERILTAREKLFLDQPSDDDDGIEIETQQDMIKKSSTPLVSPDAPQTSGPPLSPTSSAFEKYKAALESYGSNQMPLYQVGLGKAAGASQKAIEEARSARGGLGAFQQPTALELLTGAANQASQGISEAREERGIQDVGTLKELARIEAGQAQAKEEARRWEIEHGTPDPLKINPDYYATQAPSFINELGLEKDSEELANFNATATRNFSRFNKLFPEDNHPEIIEKTLIYSSMAGDGDKGYDRDVADKLSRALEISLLAKKNGWDPMTVDGSYEFFAKAYKTKGGEWDEWRAFVLEDTD